MRLRLGERGRAEPAPAIVVSDDGAEEPTVDGAATAARSGPAGDRWLRLLVFVAGICSLSLEVCTPRLIGPYFGTSLLVWANVIGFFLLYLALGYWLGGRVADRYPSPRLLCALTYAAALWTGLLPWISRPVLDWSVGAFDSVDAVAFYGSMVAVLLLFAVPITLLGFVAPFAIRLSVRRLGSAGRSSGSLYALSTAGSILGAFLPVLVLIPGLGVRRTLLVTSVALVGASLWGLDVPLWLPGTLGARIGARLRARWVAAMPGVILLVPLLLPNLAPLGPLKYVRGLIYYQESLYNYIQVVKEPDGTIELVLNEGHAIHSVYNPNQILTGWYWDYFLSAPYFNPGFQPQQVKRIAVIGLAAGTIARQYTAVYPGVQIDGVEIDPAIVDVGRRYFDMTEKNLHVYVADGRTFMRKTQQTYDVVAIDAFQQPYIPFQLTTREFFEEIRAHLSPHGVVCLNTGHTKTDRRLVQAFVNTLSQVFPSVYTFDVPGTFNTEVMATLQPTNLTTYQTQLSNVSGDPIMEQVASEAGPVATVARPEHGGIVFSDDQAPIEQITDQLLLSYIQQGG